MECIKLSSKVKKQKALLLQLLQYSKFQIPKTVVRASFVQVYNTCIPHAWQPAMDGQIQSTYVNMLQEQESLCKWYTKRKVDKALV